MNDLKKHILKIEGQELTIPPDVGCLDDTDLKRALTSMFPGAANSKIERVEKDGTVTITVIKLAGSKGSDRRSRSRKKRDGLVAILPCKSRRNRSPKPTQNYTQVDCCSVPASTRTAW